MSKRTKRVRRIVRRVEAMRRVDRRRGLPACESEAQRRRLERWNWAWWEKMFVNAGPYRHCKAKGALAALGLDLFSERTMSKRRPKCVRRSDRRIAAAISAEGSTVESMARIDRWAAIMGSVEDPIARSAGPCRHDPKWASVRACESGQRFKKVVGALA